MSEEQIRILYREAADKEKQVVILCQLTNRPKKEICAILGIPYKEKNHTWGWTEEQLQFLKANIDTMNDAELGKIFQKAPGTVKQMRLKLTGKKRIPNRWSDEDIEFLRKAYKNGIGKKRIGQYLGRTPKAITAKIYELKAKGEIND